MFINISFWRDDAWLFFRRRQALEQFLSRTVSRWYEPRREYELAGQTVGWSNPQRLYRSGRPRRPIYCGHTDQHQHGFIDARGFIYSCVPAGAAFNELIISARPAFSSSHQ